MDNGDVSNGFSESITQQTHDRVQPASVVIDSLVASLEMAGDHDLAALDDRIEHQERHLETLHALREMLMSRLGMLPRTGKRPKRREEPDEDDEPAPSSSTPKPKKRTAEQLLADRKKIAHLLKDGSKTTKEISRLLDMTVAALATSLDHPWFHSNEQGWHLSTKGRAELDP